MKTNLGFKELAELSDKELIERYDYVVEKYGGEDIRYEMTNLAWEIANRFRVIVNQNKIPIKERTRGFFERA